MDWSGERLACPPAANRSGFARGILSSNAVRKLKCPTRLRVLASGTLDSPGIGVRSSRLRPYGEAATKSKSETLSTRVMTLDGAWKVNRFEPTVTR